MQRRNFIKASAAVIATAIPGSAVLANPEPNPGTTSSEPLNRAFGFFDCDCLEFSEKGKRQSSIPLLGIRERAWPLNCALKTLHSLARDNHHPLAFSTCCSGRMPQPGEVDGVLTIPSRSADASWKERLDDHSLFYLQKQPGNDRCYLMSETNENAPEFFRSMRADRWVIFGNGGELCVRSGCAGMLKAGCKVILLSDVLAPSAQGYGHHSGTPEGRTELIADMRSLGAKILTLGDFLQEYNNTVTKSHWDNDRSMTVFE